LSIGHIDTWQDRYTSQHNKNSAIGDMATQEKCTQISVNQLYYGDLSWLCTLYKQFLYDR